MEALPAILRGWALSHWVKGSFVIQNSSVPYGRLKSGARSAFATYHFLLCFFSLRMARSISMREALRQPLPGAFDELATLPTRLFRLWFLALPLGTFGVVVLDEIAFLAALVVGQRGRLAGTPAAARDDDCCICQGTEAGPMRNYCPQKQHVTHERCLHEWYDARQPFSHRCPLCRATLRTSFQPLQRLSTALTSRRMWGNGMIYRLGITFSDLLLACALATIIAVASGIKLSVLRRRVHGER